MDNALIFIMTGASPILLKILLTSASTPALAFSFAASLESRLLSLGILDHTWDLILKPGGGVESEGRAISVGREM